MALVLLSGDNLRAFLLCIIYLIITKVNALATNDVATPTVELQERSGMLSNFLGSLNDFGGQVVKSTLERIQKASVHTSFLFFPSQSGDEYVRLKVGDKHKLLKAGFDVHKKTKILIHGWTRNGTDPFTIEVKEALLKREDMNMFSVDWPKLSQKMYTMAYAAVPYIGNRTADFIDFLVKDVGVDLASIHLIGYSLGAHIAGAAGEGISSGKIPRITGLDPAGPFFLVDKDGRLDASDAEFVDVIHTTAGTVGYEEPCGTVDFYPNGGHNPQPGCEALSPSCSHGRSYQYFAESVNSQDFVARRCKDWDSFKSGKCSETTSAVMGYDVETGARGLFFLTTNSKSPFAKGSPTTKGFLAKFLNYLS